MYSSDFSTLFELLPIGAYRSSADGRQIRANAALVRLNGYASEAELLLAVNDIGREWYVDAGRRDVFRALIERDGQVLNFRSEVYRHKTRERIWILENAHAVRDGGGTVLYFEGTVEDVTEAHRAQSALEASERRFRALTEKAQVLTVVCGEQGDVMYASPAARPMLGHAPDGLRGSNVFGWMHPDDAAHARVELQKVLAYTNSGVESIYRYQHANGEWRYLASLATNCLADNAVQGIVLNFTDVSERKIAETALMELNRQLTEKTALLQTTLGSISQGILMIGANGRLITYNARVSELLELPESLLAGQPAVREITCFQLERGDFGPEARLVDPHARDYVASGGHAPVPKLYMRTTRAGRTLEVNTQPLPGGGQVRTFTDVTEHVLAERARKRLNLLLEATQAMARIGGWEVDLRNDQVFWTDEVYRILETSPEEYTPTTATTMRFFTPDSMQKIGAAINDAVYRGKPHDMELQMVTAKGRHIWVHSASMITREHGHVVKRTSVIQDITERKLSEALIWQQANFDILTGLPNRRMLRDRLEHEIRKSDREGMQLAILFIDLDHFKEVNDTLGHDVGDQLLVEAARRIRQCVRESDTVARMGGDEFTLVLSDLHGGDRLERILEGLLGALSSSFQLGNEQVFVSASIGITMYPSDATEVENLFKNADQALYVAKGAGRNRFSFFTPALQEAAQNRVRLANDLRFGLAEQQFRVAYQPIVDLRCGAVHKAEALIRWQHPTRGLISPAEFIPIAESSGLIIDIGDWVFQQAMAQAKRWRATHHPGFQISVNKSPVQFHNDAGRQQSWVEHMRAMELGGDGLVVEITEGLLLDTSAQVTEQLLQLRDAGIQVSLDDFGTGYSSLTYLQKFDIDYIKIDQSFVRHLIPGCTELALCKAIIVMAHELDMKVIAEGVETEGQRELLAGAGCDFGQGYLFARPMPAQEFDVFLAQSRGCAQARVIPPAMTRSPA